MEISSVVVNVMFNLLVNSAVSVILKDMENVISTPLCLPIPMTGDMVKFIPVKKM